MPTENETIDSSNSEMLDKSVSKQELQEINKNTNAKRKNKSPISSKGSPVEKVKKSPSPKRASREKSSPSKPRSSANKSPKSASSPKSIKKTKVDTKSENKHLIGALPSPVAPATVNAAGYPTLDENNELPKGVQPFFMTSSTQAIFKCSTDIDVTVEKPYKLIPKAEIFEDFRLRAGVSDFHPLKTQINEYLGEEILVGYDPDFAFGQNFFIVLTEEAKEAILHPPEVDEIEEEEVEVIHKWVPPVFKEWVSLGSEKEVKNEKVHDRRNLVTMSITRPRKKFGAPVQFADVAYKKGKEGYLSYVPEPTESEQIQVLQIHKGTQAVATTEEQSTQTTWRYPRNATTQYKAREFTDKQCDEVLKKDDMKEFISSVSNRFEVALQQNEIMNIFHNDWLNLGDAENMVGSKADNHLKEYQSFTDLQFSKAKMISHIEWHPSIRGVIAVSIVSKLSFCDFVDISSKHILKPSLILLWSFTDPIHPQLLLEAPDDIYCFKFSPTNPNFVAGGCLNGQVVLWDLTEFSDRLKQPKSSGRNKKATAIPGFEDPNSKKIPRAKHSAVSSIESSHTRAITDISWIPCHMEISKNTGVPCEGKSGDCVQLMTCAADHQIMVWDVRASKAQMEKSKLMKSHMGVPITFRHLDLIWKPILKVYTQRSEPGGDHSPTKFSIEEQHSTAPTTLDESADLYPVAVTEASEKKKVLESVKTHFFVGTEDGSLVYVDWMPQKDADTGKTVTPKPDYYHTLHDGPIVCLKRSPFYKDILLCAGGWTISIWKDGVTTGPILQSAATLCRLTDAIWSLTRPGVFYIACSDGSIHIWDLSDRTHQPSLKQSVASLPLTGIKLHVISNNQHLLAVGDMTGTLHILEIPWSLRQPTVNEFTAVSNYFEREVKRRAFVSKRWDMREEEKRNIEIEAQKKAGIAPHVQLSEEEMEAKDRQEYEEYLKLELIYLRELGLRDDEDVPPSA